MSEAVIGGVRLGGEQPVAVIAELGICHRGDLALAKELATAGAEAGADFIKFEIYQLDTALTKPYREQTTFTYSDLAGKEYTVNLFEAFESGFLSYADADELIEHIKGLGKPFFATTTSIAEAEFMISRGACAVKLSSGEVDHIPLIRYCAEQDIAVFLDLAKSNLWEVARACEEYQGGGGSNIVIMHNPVGYPAAPDFIDLRRIRALDAALDAPVGYTCHSPGTSVIAAAIGMGAVVVEKPICPDKTLPYIEYAFAEDMDDYRAFVEMVRFLGRALGDPHRIWSDEVLKQNLVNRHGAVATRDLPAGHVLGADDIAIARPGLGVRPEHAAQLPGRTLKRALREGEVVRWEDV